MKFKTLILLLLPCFLSAQIKISDLPVEVNISDSLNLLTTTAGLNKDSTQQLLIGDIKKDFYSGFLLRNDTLFIDPSYFVNLSSYNEQGDNITTSKTGNVISADTSYLATKNDLLKKQDLIKDTLVATPTGGILLQDASENFIDSIVNGTAKVIENSFIQTGSVVYPDSFSMAINISVERSKGNSYVTSIDDISDFRDSFFVAGKAYYVDPIKGNDSNSGLSRADAFENYSFARSRPDVDIIYLKGAIYPDIGTFLTNRPRLSVIGYEGKPVIGKIADEKTWSTTSTTGVYKTPVSDTVIYVLDLKEKGKLGNFVMMKKVGSISELKGGFPSYTFVSGVSDTLYVSTRDGATPSTYSNTLIVEKGVFTFGASNTTDYYLENLHMIGGFSMANGNNHYLRNCDIFYSPNNDLVAINGVNCVLSECNIAYSAFDLIDHSNNSNTIQHNVTARFAGFNTSGSDNQLCTGHTGAKILTINSDFRFASNQVIFDVNQDTRRLILGGYFGHSWNKEGTFSIIGAGNGADNYSKIWVENARYGGDADYDFYSNYGSIYLRNIQLNKFTKTLKSNNGQISLY